MTSALKRLTRDAVAMGLAQINGDATPAVVLSLDRGQTYPIAGTGWSYGVSTGIGSHGSMAVTPSGKLIAVVDVAGGGQARAEIWQGTITC
jgi:hypothetical protein